MGSHQLLIKSIWTKPRSWYGNARACIDVFRIRDTQSLHWDIAARDEQADDEFPEEPGPCDKGGSHSVH
jgi:hypothetical protein